ncbi:hypothetical protein T01_4758 [Trichinella spiralis]|uniref:BAR domain-containing protein n=1 Tax=Trichinella spiralis TaxID=6334 RepID=A0A0V1B0Q8_TRISP|nr:hypothetical protein T01_4758 [Trichinella spiralis]
MRIVCVAKDIHHFKNASLFIETIHKSSKTTECKEQFDKQFEQMLNFERCLKQIVKSIRQFTDLNPSFTMMSSLIGGNKISDAELFSDCLLRMKQNCINTSNEKFHTCVALVEVKIEAARTLRNQQIHSLSIDPLNKILAEKIEESPLEEAQSYIYQSDLQSGKGHFRRVLDISDVDTSDGLSLTIDALPTTCPVSSEMTQDQVYSDECPVTREEYDEIECHLKLDHSKTGQIECTYYGH